MRNRKTTLLVALNGVAGLLAIAAMIVVILDTARLNRVERRVTRITQEVRPGKGEPSLPPPLGLPPPGASRALGG